MNYAISKANCETSLTVFYKKIITSALKVPTFQSLILSCRNFASSFVRKVSSKCCAEFS